MKKTILIPVSIFLLALTIRCGEDDLLSLSTLGLTGDYKITGSSPLSYCRRVINGGNNAKNDNHSQKLELNITNSTITLTNTVYDNGTDSGLAHCKDGDELYQVVQKFNITSLSSAKADKAGAIDNNSISFGDTRFKGGADIIDNFTVHRLTGTAGESTIKCFFGAQKVQTQGLSGPVPESGCVHLSKAQMCGLGTQWTDSQDNITIKINGLECVSHLEQPINYSDGDSLVSTDNITKVAGILVDNNTVRVPYDDGQAKIYLTLAYFTNSQGKKQVAFKEFLTTYGNPFFNDKFANTHGAFYFDTENYETGFHDNITARWGGFDNLSNMWVLK